MQISQAVSLLNDKNSLWASEEQTINSQLRQRDEEALFFSLWRDDLDYSVAYLFDHYALPAEAGLLSKVTIQSNLLLLIVQVEGSDRRMM